MILRQPPARVALVLVLAALAWGAWLRFTQLGLNTLASDETNHYFVGRALQESGEPLLPSGTHYTRGLEYSTMVAATLGRVEPIEVAVRLPSAIIGTLALVLFAVIAWRAAGPWAAVFATVLMALYPEGLRLARFGRFYTLQLLGGLVAFYAAWRLLRRPLQPMDLTRRRLLADWGWTALALAAFGYAATVQLTTLSVAAGFGAVVAAVGIRDLVVLRGAAWRWSAPLQLTLAAAAIGLGVLVFQFGMVKGLVQEALTVPMWARLSAAGAGPVSAYYRALSDDFPLVVSLSPLIFLVAIFRERRLGWLLLGWFAVPILLHSLVFPWKSERYVLLAVPALLLAAGIAAATAATALAGYLERELERLALPRLQGRGVAVLATTAIALAAIITSPAFNTSRRLVSVRESFGWDETNALLARTPELARLPIGSAQPLVALHYWGRLDFTVQRALLESWSRDSTTGGFDNPYRMKDMGSPDVYAGRPTLTTPEAIRAHFAESGAVLIGIDQKYLTYDNIDPVLRETLDREARELCQDECGAMRLYHWEFGPRREAPDPPAENSAPR